MQDVTYKGKVSFGIDSTTYSHLPAWSDLVRQKKQLVRILWLDAYFTSLMAVAIASNYFEKYNWWQASLFIIAIAGVVMLFSTIISYFSLFVKFRQTEREIRKLIYQDILFQLKNNVGKDANVSREKELV